jgi:uncharacterized protein (TIGR02597 family)
MPASCLESPCPCGISGQNPAVEKISRRVRDGLLVSGGIAFFWLQAGVASAQSASVSTTPVGYVGVTIQPTTSAQTTTTYVSLPFFNAPVYANAVSSITSGTVTVSTSTWTTNQFAQTGAPYFLKIVSGQESGRVMLITANTTNTLTVDTTDHSSQTTGLDTNGFVLQAADLIQIVPGETLASLLGDGSTGNPVQLVGGTSTFTADTVGIYSNASNRTTGYYYNTNAQSWLTNTSTLSQNSLIIYPETVLAITRRPNRPAITLALTGSVPEVTPLTKNTGGAASAVYASTRFPVDIILSNLNIPGWVESNLSFTADTIGVWDQAVARWDTYYETTSGEWLKSGDTITNQNSLVIPAGTGIVLLKRTALSGANSFLAVTMPYTL